MKKTLITITTTLLAILIVTTATYAIGTLTPSGTAGDDTQYSLNDIYTKLTAGTDGTEGSGSITVPGSVSASFRTLTEIYNSIPPTLSIIASTSTVPVGINRATTSLAIIDSDLAASNIADGVNVFGVVGTMTAIQQTGAYQWSTDQGIKTWNGAITACNDLVEGGHNDWYLPNIAILWHGMADQYFFSSHNSFVEDNSYWSSTQSSVSNGWWVSIFSFDGGINYGETDKTYDGHTVCARNL